MKDSENTSTSRPDREPKKGDQVRDPNNNPKRLRKNRDTVNKIPNEKSSRKLK